ncbi:MAG TPA: hypothetical protein VGP06_19760 [Janthinobacterium sp.]|nr:hypothetical protein [Janthinobacterium sp.]
MVGPNRDVEVVGARGALLLDLSAASTDDKLAGFNVSNAKISYLDRGDRYNIATHVFTPAPDKGPKLDAMRPVRRGPLFYADVLGNSVVLDLMEKLIDGDQRDALGIAFGNPAGETPDTGFEFKFSKTADSAGYASSVTDAYSVQNLRLDIRPIVLSQPLYQYR